MTNKGKGMTLNYKAIELSSSAIRSSGIAEKESLFLVHGGGSFGHYWAKAFGLGKNLEKTNPKAVSKISAAMLELHSAVLNGLTKHGISCYTMMASELIEEASNSLTKTAQERLTLSYASNMIPVSFGNVMISDRGSYILSGDTICEIVAKNMWADRVIFATDVDGLYATSDLKGEILSEIRNEVSFGKFKNKTFDVTGGMGSKYESAIRIAKMGTDVYFVNGLKRNRLRDLLARKHVRSTLIPRHWSRTRHR